MKMLISVSLLLVAGLAYGEESMTIKGMNCGACEKQINKVVCKDKEMSTWFAKCESHVTDAKKEIGVLKFTTKKGNSLTMEQIEKVTAAVKSTGREVLAAGATETPAAAAPAAPAKK